MKNYSLAPLTEMVDIHDYLREPVCQTERNKREGPFPYFGATGQVCWIDEFRQDGKYVLLGEDGAPFLDPQKPKAYIFEGKCWVNNHAHVLKGKDGICDDEFLCFALNWADYSNAVTGSTRLKLPQNTMNRLFIPKLPIEKQRQIAARLKAQLAEVDKARQAAEAQLADASLLATCYRENSIDRLRDVPRLSLGDLLLVIEAGKSFKTTEQTARPDELGVLKVSSVSWNRFLPQEAKSVEGVYQPDERHRVKKGDLIISRANTMELVGAVVRVHEEYPLRLLSDKTLRLVVNEDKVLPDYLLTVLQWPEARTHIEKNATGTSDSMRNISQKTINTIPVPLLSKNQQRKIISKSEAVHDEIEQIRQGTRKILADLALLPQKILTRAFSFSAGGEIL